MLRNKNTPLPLHHGNPLGNGSGVNAALDKGMSLLGMATTKTGSGDKEPAYVVKQNSMLKCFLCLLAVGAVGLIVLFSSVLELKIAKRGLILSEATRHQREHHDHEEIIRTSLELQESLEATIEETSLVEEFRAFFEKGVGQTDDATDKLFQNSGVSREVIEKAKGLQHEFAHSVQVRLDKILNRFQRRASQAREKVRKLARMMAAQIDEDAEGDKRFEKKLKELGVDEDYAEKLESQYVPEEGEPINPGDMEDLTEEERQMSPDELKKRQAEKLREHERETESEIEEQLEIFFNKLRDIRLPSVSPDAIPKLEKAMEEFRATLADETKEVDLDVFQKRMEQLIMEVAPGALGGEETFDPNQHDSVMDYYAGFIERAKLYPHRQGLLDLYNGWKSPGSKITGLNVLGAIENVAYKEHLMKIFDLLEGNEMDPNTKTADEVGEKSKPPLERQRGSRNLLADETQGEQQQDEGQPGP